MNNQDQINSPEIFNDNHDLIPLSDIATRLNMTLDTVSRKLGFKIPLKPIKLGGRTSPVYVRRVEYISWLSQGCPESAHFKRPTHRQYRSA